MDTVIAIFWAVVFVLGAWSLMDWAVKLWQGAEIDSPKLLSICLWVLAFNFSIEAVKYVVRVFQ